MGTDHLSAHHIVYSTCPRKTPRSPGKCQVCAGIHAPLRHQKRRNLKLRSMCSQWLVLRRVTSMSSIICLLGSDRIAKGKHSENVRMSFSSNRFSQVITTQKQIKEPSQGTRRPTCTICSKQSRFRLVCFIRLPRLMFGNHLV